MLSRDNQKSSDVTNALNSIAILLDVAKRNPEAIAIGLGLTLGLVFVAALINSGGSRNASL